MSKRNASNRSLEQYFRLSLTKSTYVPIPASRFLTRTLEQSSWGDAVTRVMAAAIAAVEPGAAVSRYLKREGDLLIVGKKLSAGERCIASERCYDLQNFRRIWIIAVGKASLPMAAATAQILGEKLHGGLVITKGAQANLESKQASQSNAAYSTPSHVSAVSSLPACLKIIEAGHPIPDARSVYAARQMRSMLEGAGPADLVIGLISGGGSALLASPADGLSLDDYQSLTNTLLGSGARIDEINILRKHLEQLKGGRLAQFAAPSALVCLALSDVIGDSLESIASGLTVADPTTYAEAYEILERYQIVAKVPPAALDILQQGTKGKRPETPKPGDPIFERVHNLIIGSNLQAAQAALKQAVAEGWNSLLLTTVLQGEARQAGGFLAAVLRQVCASGHPTPRPACIIAGGETTVTLCGDGLGGRNQELALSAVHELAGLENALLISLATDGGDGPTDAAGAVVSGETLQKAQALGLDPLDFLTCNDAYYFFEPLGDLIRTGPTQTNVNDLAFLFAS